jgi:exocyst complex component 2
MPKLNLNFDEAAILKAYKISSLKPSCDPFVLCLFAADSLPRKWEDVDHELADSVAGALVDAGAKSSEMDGDPLGLRSRVKYVQFSPESLHITDGSWYRLKDMDMESSEDGFGLCTIRL